MLCPMQAHSTLHRRAGQFAAQAGRTSPIFVHSPRIRGRPTSPRYPTHSYGTRCPSLASRRTSPSGIKPPAPATRCQSPSPCAPQSPMLCSPRPSPATPAPRLNCTRFTTTVCHPSHPRYNGPTIALLRRILRHSQCVSICRKPLGGGNLNRERRLKHEHDQA
jgi:hypothetical protein